MARDLLPSAVLFPPHRGEAQMFGLALVGHLASPEDGLASGDDDCVSIAPDVLDLAIVLRNLEEARSHHAEHLLFVDKLIQRIGDHKVVGPEALHDLRIFDDESLHFSRH